MPPFPLFKLAAILIKQVGKPLANFAKERAKSNHFFRTYVCMPPAQFYHWCEVRMKMSVMGIGKSAEKNSIPKLNEHAAIELGASLLGEGVIFLIATAILTLEYSRQKSNERRKEESESDFLMQLESKINDLSFSNEKIDTELREIKRLVYAHKAPSLNGSKPINKSSSKDKNNDGVIQNKNNDGKIQNKNNDGIIQNKNNGGRIQNKNNDGIIQNKNHDGIIRNKNNDGIIQNKNNDGITRNKNNDGIIRNKNNEGIIQNTNNEEIIQNKNNDEIIQNKNNDGIIQTAIKSVQTEMNKKPT